jgi:hypothetical protein
MVPPGGLGVPTQRILLGYVMPAAALGPTPETGNVTFCGRVLPRNDPIPSAVSPEQGPHWRVQCFSVDKLAAATVCVDYVIQTFPNTDARDSPT